MRAMSHLMARSLSVSEPTSSAHVADRRGLWTTAALIIAARVFAKKRYSAPVKTMLF